MVWCGVCRAGTARLSASARGIFPSRLPRHAYSSPPPPAARCILGYNIRRRCQGASSLRRYAVGGLRRVYKSVKLVTGIKGTSIVKRDSLDNLVDSLRFRFTEEVENCDCAIKLNLSFLLLSLSLFILFSRSLLYSCPIILISRTVERGLIESERYSFSFAPKSERKSL